MKRTLITLIFIFTTQLFAADCVIYKGKFSFGAIAHIDQDGVIYENLYGYNVLAHIEKDVVYLGRSSHSVLAHVEDNVAYFHNGSSAIAHSKEDDTIYESKYTYTPVSHSKDTCSQKWLLLGTAALIVLQK